MSSLSPILPLDRHLARRRHKLRCRRPVRPVLSCLGRAEAQTSALRQSEINDTRQQKALEYRSEKEEAPSVRHGGGGDTVGGQGEAAVGFTDGQKGRTIAVMIVLWRCGCGRKEGNDVSNFSLWAKRRWLRHRRLIQAKR